MFSLFLIRHVHLRTSLNFELDGFPGALTLGATALRAVREKQIQHRQTQGTYSEGGKLMLPPNEGLAFS
jgi:hypothetical protein